MFGRHFVVGQVNMSEIFLETVEQYITSQHHWKQANDFAAEVGKCMLKDSTRRQAVLEEMVHLAKQKRDAARDLQGRRLFRRYLGGLANALHMYQILSQNWINQHVTSASTQAYYRDSKPTSGLLI